MDLETATTAPLDVTEPATSAEQPRMSRDSTNFKRLHRRLAREMGKAIADYSMIQDGDRIMVCLSGGKDSYTMLTLLTELQRRAPVSFEIIAMNLDQKQPGFPEHILPRYLDGLGVDYRIIEADTYSIVKEKVPADRVACSLCSRLRRGVIYRAAAELGATKIALGHHRDDMVETLFLNLFHTAKLKGMPPKLLTNDARHVVIRPLAYCVEADIARFARAMEYPIIPCNLCGTQPQAQRAVIKEMLQGWERLNPGRLDAIFHATQDIRPSQLADRELFDFDDLETQRAAAADTLEDVPGSTFEHFSSTRALFSFD
ncbi:tRNA 2-thiocytidine(32) synthetase TtcA [Alphaproteobacteria bacterium]|nr:tRNA 2-thiocytidine(32) synthetase TtcA [Alphaproteobacteria bacterium]